MSINLQRIELDTLGVKNEFNVRSPSKKDEYILTDVKGLTGSDINVNFQKTLYAGAVHMGSRPNEREITLTMLLNPNRSIGSTVESLRDKMYMHILPSEMRDNYTKILLHGSEKTIQVLARVSQIEADLYSKKPSMQVSFMCNSAYFEDIDYTTKAVTVNGSSYTFNIDHNSVATPIFIRAESTNPYTSFSVTTTANSNSLGSLEISGFTQSGGTKYKIELDSNPLDKSLRYLSYVDTTWYYANAFKNLTRDKNTFPLLYPGANVVEVKTSSQTSQTITIQYKTRYSGV